MWKGRSRHKTSTAASKRLRPAMIFAALLAVFLQAFVVQTHVHALGIPYSLNYEQPADATHDASVHVSAGSEHKRLCVVCQALATSATATLASTAAVVVPDQSSTMALIALSLAPRVQSHSWRSRAPPSFL